MNIIYINLEIIVLVSQEPDIFKRSVYENILYGKLDAIKMKFIHQ